MMEFRVDPEEFRGLSHEEVAVEISRNLTFKWGSCANVLVAARASGLWAKFAEWLYSEPRPTEAQILEAIQSLWLQSALELLTNNAEGKTMDVYQNDREGAEKVFDRVMNLLVGTMRESAEHVLEMDANRLGELLFSDSWRKDGEAGT